MSFIPKILIIAGSDSGGGAGIQADIKTTTFFKGYAMTVVTAITAQNTIGVQSIYPLPKQIVIDQINSINSDINQKAVDYGLWQKKMVGYMHKKGISFMAGTDTPIGFLVPGLSLHHEIEELHESGLPALEAIQSATTNPAKYFNLENSLGRIKSGFVADLIILAKNPIEDISNTKSILAVIKEGNLMDRTYLDSLISK